MSFGKAGTFGKPSTLGGITIPEWGTGIFLTEGTDNQVVYCTCATKPSIAKFQNGQWSLIGIASEALAYSLANPMPPGAVIPTSIYAYQSGMEISYTGINDGSAWFAPTGAARASAWEIRNPSTRTANKVTLIYPNSVNGIASSVRANVATGGGGNDGGTYSAIQTTAIPAGVGGLALTASLGYATFDLPAPVAPGGRALVRVEFAAGLPMTGSSSAGSNADPISYYSNPNLAQPNQALDGTWDPYFPGIGMSFCGVQWHLTGNPIVRILHSGDSVGVGVSPLADPTPAIRTSWIWGINDAESAFDHRFCISSIGNGGLSFEQYMSRVEHLVDTQPALVQSLWDGWLAQMSTWNQVPQSTGDLELMQGIYTRISGKLAALGIWSIPMMLTPPGSGKQTAGMLTQYQAMRSWVIAQGGIDMTDLIADTVTPTELDPARSYDGVHIDSDAGPAFGQAAHPRYVSALIAKGVI